MNYWKTGCKKGLRITYTTTTTEEFLAEIVPFNRLSSNALTRVSAKAQLQRYRMGQPILLRDKMPAQIAILYQGQARLLGYEPGSQLPVTLQRLEPGAIVGWAGLVRSVACETAIAREYLLKYDPSKRQTTIEPGYFW